jgi:hypothetical protein
MAGMSGGFSMLFYFGDQEALMISAWVGFLLIAQAARPFQDITHHDLSRLLRLFK